MYNKRVTQDKVEISDDPRETNRHVAFIGCIQKLSDPSNSTDEHKKNTVRCFLKIIFLFYTTSFLNCYILHMNQAAKTRSQQNITSGGVF